MTTKTAKLVLSLAGAAAIAGAAAPVQAQLGTVRLDNWFFYQQNYGDTGRWQWRPRVFVPFNFGDGWTFTQRADLPLYYTDATGPDNPGGGWKFGVSDFLVEEIIDTPELAKDFRLRGSVRLVFPTGEAPFGADQWQVAPGFGFTWRFPEAGRGVTVAPYARYFYGFDAGSASVTTKRQWNIFPTVTFGMSEKWSLVFYPEQGITYNDRTDQWFVPIEFMVTNRVNKQWEYSVGGAYNLDVDDDRSYRWLVQGRLTYYFD
jgi:hypothetical protein